MSGLSYLRNRLSDRQKNLGRRALRALLAFLPHRHRLDLLALKHGTDKWGHGYMEPYRQAFAPLRNESVTLLEIGVGKPGNAREGGESLRTWRDFFPKGMIHGIDIEDKSHHEEERIKIFQGDQGDPASLEEIARRIGPLDIIIDDGSHVNEHVINSFRTLFPFLKDGGTYVVEDSQTSYWPRYGGQWEDLDHPGTTMSMLKGLADGMNYRYIPDREPTYFDTHVESIHFFRNIVFIRKGTNRHVLSSSTLQEIEAARTGTPSRSPDTPR
jgi:hypothetical protein